MACYHCSQLCTAYATLKGNLRSINGQVSTYKDACWETHIDFTKVIISGKQVGLNDFHSVNRKLASISGHLTTLISECDQKIEEISSSCPGEDHYDD